MDREIGEEGKRQCFFRLCINAQCGMGAKFDWVTPLLLQMKG